MNLRLNILQILVFCILSIGMLSGLSTAVMFPTFIVLMFTFIKRPINYGVNKIILSFMLYASASIFWSYDIKLNAIAILQAIPFGALVLIICLNSINFPKNVLYKPLSIGFIIAIVLYYIEYFTHGFITVTFRKIFQEQGHHEYFTYFLDRGCGILSCCFWLLLAFKKDKPKFTIPLYVITALLLYGSDSLASFLGFLAASVTYVSLKVISTRLIVLYKYLVCLFIIIVPLAFGYFSPYKIVEDFNFLPLSAKHRIFIWNYSTELALETPIIGRGLNYGKYTPEGGTYIDYQGSKMSLLPNHSHNISIQTLLDLGIIGFILLILSLNVLHNKLSSLSKVDSNISIAAYCCFINYFMIAMISYNMWQTWWLLFAFWLILMFKIIVESKSD